MASLTGFEIAFIATDGVEQWQLETPWNALLEEGAQLTLIGIHEGWIQSFRGLDSGRKFQIGRTIDQVRIDQFDALVIPGGPLNIDELRTQVRVIAFIREFEEAGKPIATLAHAPWLLISTGLMRGRTLTSSPSLADDVCNAGAQWVDLPVIADRNWITGRGKSEDLGEFMTTAVHAFGRSTPPVIQVAESA